MTKPQPTKQTTMQVIIESLPLPSDFSSRLAQIYLLLLKRYHEHAAEIEQRKEAEQEKSEVA